MSSWIDRIIVEFDQGLRSLAGGQIAAREFPQETRQTDLVRLSESERRHAAGLMRVDHVGEVCAQALYRAQALTAKTPALCRGFEEAADEEADHLAWTAQRLKELEARPSLLNPLWYAGAYALGLLAGRAGDRVSLGFVVETERQVEEHLARHLESLPANDTRSQALLSQMKDDEVRHGEHAQQRGASDLPAPVTTAMRVAAKIMTSTAYWL
jgi:ubiquinone biosynthesis monooxygenase Coq7